jgi:NAD(P)-dependent dehydrogenase (short-subunit alcohol dehydrogenase family)
MSPRQLVALAGDEGLAYLKDPLFRKQPCYRPAFDKMVDIVARDATGETELKCRHRHAGERLGQPGEAGATAAFLASAGAAFIAGTAVPVVGGLARVCQP